MDTCSKGQNSLHSCISNTNALSFSAGQRKSATDLCSDDEGGWQAAQVLCIHGRDEGILWIGPYMSMVVLHEPLQKAETAFKAWAHSM